jgi:hypothetical protein
MIDASCDNVADDIVKVLREKNKYRVIRYKRTDLYDPASSAFVLTTLRDTQFGETWSSFCNRIKHHERHFNKTATSLLSEILGPVVRGEWPRNGSAIRQTDPNGAEWLVYRGRVANSHEVRRAICSSPFKNLASPPPHLCVAGRMNPAGIGVFYGSFDIATCVAELRPPVGGSVVVGKFLSLRPLRVLDMTVLDEAAVSLSYFDPDFGRQSEFNEFLRGFHNEIKRPVIPGAEPLEYLPTQFVAEYLWSHVDPPFDGIIFGSSQISGGGRNLVLFPGASRVAGYDQRIECRIRDRGFGCDATDETYVIASELHDRQDMLEADGTLRLLINEIEVCQVEAIEYELKRREVRMLHIFEEWRVVDSDDRTSHAY